MAPSPANFLEILIGEQCNNSASNARSGGPVVAIGKNTGVEMGNHLVRERDLGLVHWPVRSGTSLDATFAWGRLREDMVPSCNVDPFACARGLCGLSGLWARSVDERRTVRKNRRA